MFVGVCMRFANLTRSQSFWLRTHFRYRQQFYWHSTRAIEINILESRVSIQAPISHTLCHVHLWFCHTVANDKRERWKESHAKISETLGENEIFVHYTILFARNKNTHTHSFALSRMQKEYRQKYANTKNGIAWDNFAPPSSPQPPYIRVMIDKQWATCITFATFSIEWWRFLFRRIIQNSIESERWTS